MKNFQSFICPKFSCLLFNIIIRYPVDAEKKNKENGNVHKLLHKC